MERRLTLLLVVFALVVVGLLPLVAMLGKSLFVDGRLTLAVYEKLFANPRRYWAPIGHSLTLATLTAGCATLLGVSLGLLLGKTDLPFRRTLAVLLSIPLLLPPYILAVCWFNLLTILGPRARVIPAGTMERLSTSLFGLPGCLLVLVTAFMPLVMILTLARGAEILNRRGARSALSCRSFEHDRRYRLHCRRGLRGSRECPRQQRNPEGVSASQHIS